MSTNYEQYWDDMEMCRVCGEEAYEIDCAVMQLESGLRVVVCSEECEEAAEYVVVQPV